MAATSTTCCLPTPARSGVSRTTAFHPGDIYGHVFTTPGTFAYYCSIHGTAKAGMIGTVVVLPADG